MINVDLGWYLCDGSILGMLCMYMRYAWIHECLCLSMFDVKLTPSGLWLPTCLYEWVDGVQEWSFSCLVSCLRIAGASSVYLLESYIRLWLGCPSLHCYAGIVMLLRFCPYVGFWRFCLVMYVDLWHVYFWRCMLYIRCDFWEILYMHDVLRFIWRRNV